MLASANVNQATRPLPAKQGEAQQWKAPTAFLFVGGLNAVAAALREAWQGRFTAVAARGVVVCTWEHLLLWALLQRFKEI